MPEEISEHVDRLCQILLDRTVPDVAGDSAGQPRHARKRPCEHRQQVVGDHLVIGVVVQLGLTRFVLGRGSRVDGSPKEDLGEDRQEPDQRREGKIGPVDEPLFEARFEDDPVGSGAGQHGGSVVEEGEGERRG